MKLFNFNKNKNNSQEKKFLMQDYLDNHGWSESKKTIFKKDFKQIRIVGRNRVMIVLDFDKKVKHKHIVTCKVPTTKSDADTLFRLTMLND